MTRLRIGTRGSLLAKWQAEFVRRQVFQATGVEGEIVIIKTSGDKLAHTSLSEIGGKGIFVKELEEALLDNSIDIAVHSVKDIPTKTPPGLSFPAILRREDIRDCLVSNNGANLAALREGARIGTGSLRRRAQLLHLRPDLDVRDLRGNVDTRLRKAESGEYDAVMLAKAGLDRLGATHRITEVFAPDIFLPAVGQGAIGVECRAEDVETSAAVEKLDDPETRSAIIAERSLLSTLEGGCQVPLGAWARLTARNTSSSAPPPRPPKPVPSANAWAAYSSPPVLNPSFRK
jgi:hydroxymethylbilane synthase